MRRKIPPPRINNIKKTVPLCNNFPASPVYLIESAFKNKFSYEQKQNKTMKKFVFTLLLVLGCQISLAQNSAALFDEFRREKNAEYVSASPFLMFIGKMFYPYNDEGKEIASKIRSAKILDLDECSPDVKQRFSRQFEALSNNGYETLMQMNEDGERIHIQMRMKKEVIRELLIAIIEDDECSLIQVNGKIRKQDIAQLINDQTTNKKKHGRR
jgi:hypothetical protein